ncbi:hypothetical protein DM860_016150 [Cuscuta australis]|uniref:Uncharacterized protein n=1 Tax=Cuscuta australis TaxID=267555 RepID=A0A328E750_9ASTE|nr:hypothetical protein DM860_016150 [Cuscuta australis]
MTRPVSWRGNPEFAAMAARAFRFVTWRSRSEPQRLPNSCSWKNGLGVGKEVEDKSVTYEHL